MASQFVLGAGTVLQGQLADGFPSVKALRRSNVTTYPTESGIDLVDNVDVQPWMIEIRGIVNGYWERGISLSPTIVWRAMRAMQDLKRRLSYHDNKNSYENLVIAELEETSDDQSGLGLSFRIVLQEVRDATTGLAFGTYNVDERYNVADDAMKERLPASTSQFASAATFVPDPYYGRIFIGQGARSGVGQVIPSYARVAGTPYSPLSGSGNRAIAGSRAVSGNP